MATSLSPRQARDDARDGETDFAASLRRIWQGRVTIALVSVFCAALGAMWSLAAGQYYEGVATVSVTPPTLPDPTNTLAQVVSRVVTLLPSQKVAEQLVHEFKLDAPPRAMSASSFLTSVLTVRAVGDSNLVRVVARTDEPGLAANLANRAASLGINHVLDVAREGFAGAETGLRTVVDEAARHLDDAQTKYRTYRSAAQIDLTKADVDSLLAQRSDFRTLQLELQQAKARLASAEAELAKRKPLNTLIQSIDSNKQLAEAARATGRSSSDLLELQTRTETVNEVFQQLDSKIADSRAEIAALEQGLAQLGQVNKVSGSRLAPLLDLYVKESELNRLDLELSLARKMYEDTNTQYQSARLAAISRLPILTVVDPAVAPERPASRWFLRNSTLGLALGLLAGSCFVLTREVFRRG